MRKTATFRDQIIKVSRAISADERYQLAVEQLSHERPAVSESARLDQLAYIGAVAVERSAKELAYAELATAMRNDIGPGYVQTAMGPPIDGETDEDLKKLFEELGDQ